MWHRWLWLGVLVLASTAYAQTFTVQGSSGWGTAVGEANKPALFRYEVKKVVNNDTQRQVLQGAFRFTVVNREERSEVTIQLERLAAYRQRISDTEKVAEFRGPAVLSIITPRGGRRVPGELTVIVRDNRAPNVQEGTPDEIAVRFTARDPNKPFGFLGKVVRGDIVVFERHLPR